MRELRRSAPPEMARLERIISVLAPMWALRRAAARETLRAWNVYRGAEKSRIREDWLPGGGSADADLLNDLPALRERSRDLTRNDGYAAGIVAAMVSNIIGTGFRPQSRIDAEIVGIPEDESERIQRQAERIWARWAVRPELTGRMDFKGVQELHQRQRIENGEALVIIRRVERPGLRYRLALEFIESDRLDTPPEKYAAETNIRGGVELGRYGEPVAYWIRKAHPGDMGFIGADNNKHSQDFERIPAYNKLGQRNVLHTFKVYRPGQSRGVPLLTPALSMFKDLGDYMEAELVAARMAACFALFVKGQPGYIEAAMRQSEATNARGQRLEYFEPGMIAYLGEGQDITPFTPNRPSAAFDPYIERNLRTVAAAVNQPYEIVAKDFSKVNYSSARAALLEARRWYRMEQDDQVSDLCGPVWEALLEEAWLMGDFEGPGYEADAWDSTRARWITPGWQWVDPEKEVNAAVKAIDGNLSSEADEGASQGRDWEETHKQRARERRSARGLGIEAQTELVEQIVALITAGVELPKAEVHQAIGWKEPAGEEDSIKKPPAPAPSFPGAPPAPDEQTPDEEAA